MSSRTIDSEDRIIHRIELRGPDLSASPRIVRTTAEGRDGLAAGENSAFVVEGSAISFVGNLPSQMKFDVINSMQFAQLAANIRNDRQNDAAGWYKSYESILKDLGWTLSRKFKLAKVNDLDETSGSAGSVDRLLLKLAQNHLTGGEHALFHSMIDALKQTPNEMAVKRFDSSATGKSSKKANFQVGVVSAEGRNASFKIGVYALEASQSIDKVLFLDMDPQNVSIYADSQTMIFNEDAYSRVRRTVQDRLGQDALQVIDVQL